MSDRNAERTTAPTFVEEYRTKDKSEWGPGPWQDEPDKAVWVDELTGLDCMIHRNRVGALCGYVGVADGHPLHGRDYDDPDVRVHGGLTYAAGCEGGEDPAEGLCHIPQAGRPDEVWWFGFDCAHAYDLAPQMAERNRKYFEEAKARGDAEGMRVWDPLSDRGDIYRDLPYVIAEVRHLADQLAEVGALDAHPKDEVRHDE